MSPQHDQVRRRLLDKLLVTSQEGLWQIFGEDPNCDLGGSHHQPLLATVQGTYAAAVDYALDLPSFFTWGGGGDVRKIEVIKVDGESLRKRTELTTERNALKIKLADLEAELKRYGGR